MNDSALAAATLLLVTACASPSEPAPRSNQQDAAAARAPVAASPSRVRRTAQLREIRLSRYDSLSVAVDATGSVEIVAAILANRSDGGTYSTRNARLLDAAREARDALRHPHTDVGIRVDGKDEIVGVWTEVTRQQFAPVRPIRPFLGDVLAP